MIARRIAQGFARCGGTQGALRGQPCTLRRWRLCITVVIACLLSFSLRAPAQEKPLQIGALALGPRSIPLWQCGQDSPGKGAQERRRDTMPFYILGLLDELKKLNYVRVGPDGKPMETPAGPGRRFVLDLRMGNVQQVKAAAREFAQAKVDVIVAVATLSMRIAQEETRGSSIPILMTGVSNPVGEGFVASLARPGGSMTGVSHQQVQGSGKRVELFKEIVPSLRRLITPRMHGYSPSEHSMAEVRAAADRLKIEVLDWPLKSREELQAQLATLREDPAIGIMILSDTFVITSLDLVIEASLARRVPVFGLFDYMADWGAIAAYGSSAYEVGIRVARYVDRISKGAKPAEMPVEPLDPSFVVNLKTAECLGVLVPLKVLQQADRVIRTGAR